MLTAEVCGLPGIQTTCKAFIVHSFFWDDKQLVTNTAFTKWMCSHKLHVHWLSLSPVSLDEWGADPPGDIQPCLAAEGSTTGYSTSIGPCVKRVKNRTAKHNTKATKVSHAMSKLLYQKRVSLGLGTWQLDSLDGERMSQSQQFGNRKRTTLGETERRGVKQKCVIATGEQAIGLQTECSRLW